MMIEEYWLHKKVKSRPSGQSHYVGRVFNIKLMFLPQVRSPSTNLVQEVA